MRQDDRPLVSDDRVSVLVRSHTTIGPRISVIAPSDVLSFTLSVLTTDCSLAISQRVSLRIVHTCAELNEGHATASGETQVEVFGHLDDYDKVIVLGNADCPINENSVLFVDKKPEYDQNGDPLFDYTVKRVARSLNSVSYAIRKVEVS